MKIVTFTMPRSLEEKIQVGAMLCGKKKSEFVRDSVAKELTRLGVDVTPDDLASNQGKRRDLSEPKNLEKLKEHAREMQRKSVAANRLRSRGKNFL